MKPCTWCLSACLTLVGSAAVAQNPDWESAVVVPHSVSCHDNLEGRDSGSRGFEKAADYMAGKQQGVEEPGVDDYRQPGQTSTQVIDETTAARFAARGQSAAAQPW